MTMKITTHYKEALTSQMLNYKVETMVGENKVVEGFEVSKNNNNITISPGKCIINGAIIESDEDVNIEVPYSLQGSSDFQVIAKYSHSAKSVNFYVYEIGRSLDGNELLLSKSMTDASKMRTLTDLSASLKSIKENLAEDQILEYENEFITSTDSVEGATTELKIKGQTIVNVAPIKDEVDVYADLQATGNGSVQFRDTYDGIIDGINIKGKTYQNIQSLIDGKSFPLTATADGTQVILARADLLVKPSTKYTLVAKISQNTLNHNAMLLDWDIAASPLPRITVDAGYTGLIIQGFTSSDNPRTWSNIHIWKEATRGSITIDYIMILEGDHTNNPDLPSYFEGIIGVGDKSKNLFSTNLISGRIGEQGQWYEGSTLSTTTEFIPVMPNKTYTISKNGVAQQSNIFLYDRNKCLIKKVDNVPSTFNTTNNCYFIRLYWNRTTVDLKDKIQIEEGVNVTSYEEYYHGYKTEVLSCGKNLFDFKNNSECLCTYSSGFPYEYGDAPVQSLGADRYKLLSNGFYYKTSHVENNSGLGFYIKCKKNTNYTFSCNVSFTGSYAIKCQGIYEHEKPVTRRIGESNRFLIDATGRTDSNISKTFNSQNYDYMFFYMGGAWESEVSAAKEITFTNIQLEEGANATVYEEYTSSKAGFILDQPLMSLPNGVCDEIVGNKLIRRVGKINAGDINLWYIGHSSQQLQNTMMFATTEFDSLFVPGTELICNKFTNAWTWDTDFETCDFTPNDHSRLRIRISRGKLETQDEHGFKKWLQDNEIVFYGELASPIITPVDNDVVMPNGVHDEIIGDKAIRKVRKRILDGTEEWNASGTNPGTSDYVIFYHNKYDPHNFDGVTIGAEGDFLCDGIFEPKVCRQDTSLDSSSVTGEYITGHFSENIDEIRISILKRRLDTLDAAGFRKWLSENPTTIWYELRNSYEGPADNSVILPNGVRDEYVDGKTIRNIGKIVLDGTEEWTSSTLTTDTHRKQYVMIRENNVAIHKPQTALICDSFKVVTSLDEYKKNIESVFSDNAINISIEKSRLSEDSLDGFKKWLKENPVTVYFELKEPHYDIVRNPHLKSFAPETNITGSTLVPTPFNIESYGYRKEALIKPNTQYAIHFNNKYTDTNLKNIKIDLGGAIGNVTANNSWLMLKLTTPATLSHNELRISGFGIKVSSVMCSEGSNYREFVDGLAGVGDRSKNLFDGEFEIGSIEWKTGKPNIYDGEIRTKNFIPVKPNKYYILNVFENSYENHNIHFYDINKQWLGNPIHNRNLSSINFVTPRNCCYIKFRLTTPNLKTKVQLEEGSIATSYEPYYEGHKIEILSNGKNLFNKEDTFITGGSGFPIDIGQSITLESLSDTNHKYLRVKLPVGKKYTVIIDKRETYPDGWRNLVLESFNNNIVVGGTYRTIAKSNNSLTEKTILTFETTMPYVYIHIGRKDNDQMYEEWFSKVLESFETMQIEEGDVTTDYEPYQEDKTQILLQEPLHSLPNGVCDTIEKIDGQYVVVRRCGQMIIDGSERWINEGCSNQNNTVSFRINSSVGILKDGCIISDRFAKMDSGWITDEEGIFASAYITVRILKDRLPDGTPQSIKEWFKNNPTKVVYELAQYLITPLDAIKLPNGVTDEIKDGKRIRKVGKVVLNGSEDWKYHSMAFNEQGARCILDMSSLKAIGSSDRSPLLCDKLIVGVDLPEFIGANNAVNSIFQRIDINRAALYVIIKISDCGVRVDDSDDEKCTKVKAWLKDNPVTVWYELATPMEEDYISQNLNLDTYNETTHIASNTLVPAIINAKIPTNVGAVIKNDIRRIEVIEDLIDKVILPQLVESHYEKTLLEFDYQVSRMLK